MASLAFRTLPFVSLTNSTRAIPQRIAHNHRFPPRPRHIAMSSISREVIATENAPGAVGAYSQAIKANGFVYISGQVPLVPGVNAVYGKYFPVDPPARAAYAVRDLPLGAKVEIEAVALAP
ncbi:Ribonuclease [Auxenochlorella protothecoides]|uniref:Ribonuclease n=1 Tax=Auxenochlorella protothecoides TaxID=3075 RepID=A0A087SP88_AUXPR|nr:Ribonuclease [Auxenochlorella protothecoides]KFM27542.1 Ribonuclease [Auxenochlorella protothecoides]